MKEMTALLLACLTTAATAKSEASKCHTGKVVLAQETAPPKPTEPCDVCMAKRPIEQDARLVTFTCSTTDCSQYTDAKDSCVEGWTDGGREEKADVCCCKGDLCSKGFLQTLNDIDKKREDKSANNYLINVVILVVVACVSMLLLAGILVASCLLRKEHKERKRLVKELGIKG